jgi:hypothetical protein
MKITQMTSNQEPVFLKVGDLISGNDGNFLVVKLPNNQGYALLDLARGFVVDAHNTLEDLTYGALTESDKTIPNDKLELIIHN